MKNDKINKWLVAALCLGLLITSMAGAIQIYDRFLARSSIEVFKQPISLTASNSDSGVIAFLQRNNDKIVYIDNVLDSSLATQEHALVQAQCQVDIDAILSQDIVNVPLLLPIYDHIDELICSGHYLVLTMTDNTTYEYSAGGTGIAMIRFKGFFEITTTYHSGPSVYFHLKEIDVPFNVKMQVMQYSYSEE
ncbi:hypothetical protein [Shewanella saliphila]|uniref:Uncharacterized protein n=1 Tax=Shewanella saliphila TaxID=2282698 RepID=A0ABQ2Q604_9GAMM|nr:hypothetical protein [Shewanella saliphila]MCL1102247.1 hypothetical protein [Shewanella saliphila]GGP54600.1 hypothetical protein GCM10009409_21130 [Shewanella saliphila]